MIDFTDIAALTIPEGEVKKITYNNTVLWEKVMSSRLPSEYQEVEWISDNATNAYIDLGFAFDKGAVIKLHYINYNTSGYFFGAAENSGKLRCMITQNSATGGVIYGSNGSNYISTTFSSSDSEMDLVFTIKKGMLKCEDLLSGTVSSELKTQGEYTMTSNLLLFAQNYNGSPRTAGKYTVKAFQYYDNDDNLICDLVPCYRKSDGVIGVYDIVRKIFLTNAGTGSFTKGVDV